MSLFSSFLGGLRDIVSGKAFKDLEDKVFEIIKGDSEYEQREVSYYDSVAYKSTPQNIKKILDNNFNIGETRKQSPIDYYDYIQYNHRINDSNTIRIGDVQFCIPPTFISVTEKNSHTQLGTLRQKGSINCTNGYSNKDISIVAYFSGLNQLNGYEVKGPTGTYYVDGIRSLIAQFMVEPFAPVVNEYLNLQHGIYNVALNNIMVSTVEGYPNVYEVTLAMSEVTLTPYTEVPDIFYHDIIDWDLWRYNYQRLLKGKCKTHLKKVEDVNSTLKISQLKQDALTGNTKADTIYDDDNFDTIIDTEADGIFVENISFSMSNLIPVIQMSSNNIPTSQYMGCTDFTFSITMVSDDTTINKITSLDSYVGSLAKQYKEYGTFGFVKIDNQLINSTGSDFFIIDDITTSTIPGLPGTNKITLTVTSFDSRQKAREDINGFRPFYGDIEGTKDDAISQDSKGLFNKIKQDRVIESKIAEMELYPDLHLPTFEELDDFIKQLKDFRSANNLKQITYSKYPRPYSISPENGISSEYSKFVDPDFYVFYPLKYSNLDDEIFGDKYFKGCSKMEPVSTVGRNIDWGDECEAPDGFYYNENGELEKGEFSGGGADFGGSDAVQYSGDLAKDFVNICTDICNKHYPYVWGTDGPSSFDCSGLICYALRKLGVAPQGYRNGDDGVFNDYFTPIPYDQLKPGDICNRIGQHIAVYIGNGKTAEAMGSAYGCCFGNCNQARFNQFGRFKTSIQYKSSTSTEQQTNQSSSDSSPAYTGYNSTDNLSKFCRGALAGHSKTYQDSGAKWNLNPAFVLAITNLETGWGTSSACRNYNNPGGIMDWNNNYRTLYRFSTIDEGIDFMFKNLYNLYIKQGLTTIEQIQKKYCPIGAANDPNGTNANWLPEVTSIYRSITGNSNVQCVLDPNMDTSSIGTGGSQNKSTYKYHKCEEGGKTFGATVKDMDIKNIGKPIYKLSPVMALKVKEDIAGTIKDGFNDFKKESDKDKALKLAGEMQGGISEVIADTIVDTKNAIKNFWLFESLVDGVSDLAEASLGGFFGFDDKYVELVDSFYKNETERINSMFTDMMCSLKDKMNKAFPSYVLLFEDYGGDWIDGRRLWSNYYMYKSVIDINVAQESCQPVHTATLNITNIYHNLDNKLKASQILKKIEEDKEYHVFVRWIYELTGSLLGTPKLTNDMVRVKNNLYKTINIKTGLRIHLRLGYGSNPNLYPTCFNGIVTDLQVGDTVSIVAQSFGIELVNNIIETDPQAINKITNLGTEPTGVITDIMTARNNWFTNTVNKKWGEGSKYGIENFGISRGHEISDIVQEYDILKNIYLSSYKCKSFCNKGLWDNEKNSNFYLYNKTPNDVFQNLTQTMPEFICQPHYHGFECRLFYGLPYWVNKYKYSLEDSNNIYEYAKTYSQFHYLDDNNEIINVNVKCGSDDTYTNCVAMYTLAEKTKSSPIVYSDKTIYQAYQKTKVVDTTLTQDYVGWDWLYEKTVAPIAKSVAIKSAISNLLDSWNKTYDGDILVLGNAYIKPFDYLMINSGFADIKGLCNVREVVHSISCKHGFTTTITPGLLGMNTMKNSGSGNVYKTLISFGMSVGAVRTARKSCLEMSYSFNNAITLSRLMHNIRYEDPEIYTTITAVPNWYIGKTIFNAIGSGKIVTGFKNIFLTTTGTVSKTISAINKLSLVNKVTSAIKITNVGKKIGVIKNGLTVVGSTVAPGIGTVASWLIGTVVFDMLLGVIIDEFSYNNCIKIFPLMYKSEPFISNCYGQCNLIPGITENSDKDGNGVKIPDEQTDKENELNKTLS